MLCIVNCKWQGQPWGHKAAEILHWVRRATYFLVNQVSPFGRTPAIPEGKNSGFWESWVFFDYLFYSAGLFLTGTPAFPLAVGQLPQAPLLLRAAGLTSFHFLWISGLLMWKWNCVHARAVKCALLWLFSSLFWPTKYTGFFLVLPQVYQTLWSVSYGLSVRLHCVSSASVGFNQEAKAHSMARCSAKGLGKHTATWSKRGVVQGRGQVRSGHGSWRRDDWAELRLKS